MKKMVTYLVTLGMMLSLIPAQVSAEENAVLTVAATQDAQSPVIHPDLYMFGGYVATQSGDLNLREEANTNSKILAAIPNGTQLDIYSSGKEGWYLTIYDNKKGYVSADYIKKVEGYDERAYHEDPNIPASSISVAALAGKWTDMRTFETLEIKNVTDSDGNLALYNGIFIFTDITGRRTEGIVKLEYTLNPDNTRVYWFTFYDANSKIWCAFPAENTVQLDHLIADSYHFGQYLFGGSANVNDSLNLRSDKSADSEIIAMIPSHTQLSIFDSMVQGWYKTIFNGKIGYVSADYITEIEKSDVITVEPKKDDKDIKEIVGRWRYELSPGQISAAVCADYNGVIDVKEDGSFTYTDANNKVVSSGQITVSEEIYPDDTKHTIMTFNGEENIIFSGYYHKDENFISAGNSDMARLVKDTAWNEGIEQIAIEKLDNYSKINSILSGSLAASNTDKIKDGEYEYLKVTDSKYKTLADIKSFINANTTGELNKSLLEECDRTYKEINGALYKLNGGRGAINVETNKGLIVTDKTDKSFTATTIGCYSEVGQLHHKAVFTAVGSDWKISSIEYGVFGVNRTYEDFKLCAESRIRELSSIMSYISTGAETDAKDKIKIDGIEYAKSKYQSYTPELLKSDIDSCTTGALREYFTKIVNNRFTVKDGIVYIAVDGAQVQPDFAIENGVNILNIEPDNFTATTVASSQRDGYGIFDFKMDGDRFLISEYSLSEISSKKLFGGYVATQSGDLNLREKPNTISKILAAIPNGTQLDIYDSGMPGWYMVSYDGKIGYVSSDFIKNIDSSDIPVETTTTVTTSSATTTTTTTTTPAAKQKGDVNNDGSLTLKDVVMIRRYIAGGWNVTVDEKVADINGDGTVNLKDVVMLRRYLAGGWNVKL